MKKIILVAIAILGFACPNFAQFTTVTYDAYKNWFNEGQPLPAEKAMIIKGVLPQDAERMEFYILSSKNNNPLYSGIGKPQANNEFSLPINYRLRASDKYDFRIIFFRTLNSSKQEALKTAIKETLNTYIDVNLFGKKSIKLLKKAKKTVREMNGIIAAELAHYRSKTFNWQPVLSKVVQLKFQQLDKADLDNGYTKKDTSATRKGFRENTRQQLVAELKQQIEREVDRMLDGEMLIQNETFSIDNYPTESKENSLSINVGYGGVFISGNLDDFTYGSSPYVGLAFPLGNSVLGSKFLSNSSVTIGFFLENFKDENDKPITGFLINRPIYLGLDHKLFKFLRVNAGAAFLEGTKIPAPANPDVTSGKNVMVRPFIGLSARIDLSIGLGK